MRYGPGKFEGCGNYAKVAEYLYESCDEELGDVEFFGWYGKFAGKIKGRGPFFAVVSEDSNGFVDVTYYDTEQELENEWCNLQDQWSDAQGPDDDAVTTEDHCTFYQYGKVVLECDEDDDYKAKLREWMEQQRSWPDVWFVSDHGNAHRIDLAEEK